MPSSAFIDRVRFAISDIRIDVGDYFSGLGWWALVAFLPFILLDLRRFLGPSLALLVLRQFGLPRDRDPIHQRFLATRPRVSVVLAGYNEEAAVVPAITSLIETGFPGLEIIRRRRWLRGPHLPARAFRSRSAA